MNDGRSIRISSGMILVLGLCFLLPVRGHATLIFTKVADTNTLAPGGADTFSAMGPPAISQGAVVFRGLHGSNSGIYSTLGGSLDVVADESTHMPLLDGNFTSFGYHPSISNGAVSFQGSGTDDQTGVFTAFEDQGEIELFHVIDQRFLNGKYDYFGDPSASGGPMSTGGSMAFRARNLGTDADSIRLRSGGVWRVADESTAIPGGTGDFERFYHPSHSGDQVVFWGAAGTEDGVYLYTLSPTGGSLDVVADQSTPIPGGTGNFNSLALGLGGRPAISEGNIAFRGSGSNQSGIYSTVGGGLDVVADKNTPIPGGTANFLYFDDPTISGDTIAFVGKDAALNTGIYVAIDGELDVIIDDTHTLDGKAIEQLWLGPQALDGQDIAF